MGFVWAQLNIVYHNNRGNLFHSYRRAVTSLYGCYAAGGIAMTYGRRAIVNLVLRSYDVCDVRFASWLVAQTHKLITCACLTRWHAQDNALVAHVISHSCMSSHTPFSQYCGLHKSSSPACCVIITCMQIINPSTLISHNRLCNVDVA